MNDLRAELEAMAAGQRTEQPRNAVDARLVERNQAAFRAWFRFAHGVQVGRGEPLTAPAQILTPLP